MPQADTLVRVDVAALWRAVAIRLAERQMNQLDLSTSLGLAKQTISSLRMAAGSASPRPRYQPSVGVFMTLCWWLGADPRDFAVQVERQAVR
jgi:DNA-binding XRE family transcriptional regulator